MRHLVATDPTPPLARGHPLGGREREGGGREKGEGESREGERGRQAVDERDEGKK